MRSSYAVLVGLLLPMVAGCGDSGEGRLDDTRWVGSDRVVVAVPSWWSTGETTCQLPVEDTVYADNGAIADCADPPARSEVRAASTLAVLDGAYADRLVTRMEPAGTVDGHQVVELDGCDRWIPGVCRHVFAVPDLDVVLAVAVADPADGDYDEIRGSLRILPVGQTTVPLAAANGWTPSWGDSAAAAASLERTLRAAGLEVEVRTLDPSSHGDAGDTVSLPPGSLLDVDPGLGSVVPEGATVTITVMGS